MVLFPSIYEHYSQSGNNMHNTIIKISFDLLSDFISLSRNLCGVVIYSEGLFLDILIQMNKKMISFSYYNTPTCGICQAFLKEFCK